MQPLTWIAASLLLTLTLIYPQPTSSSSTNKLHLHVKYDSLLCQDKGACYMNVYTSLDYTATTIMNMTTKSEYRATFDYDSSMVNQEVTFSITLYIVIANTKNSTIIYIAENCPDMFFDITLAGGRNLGPNYMVKLRSESTTMVVYPYFCLRVGQTKTFSQRSSEFKNTRTIYVVLPPNFVENSLYGTAVSLPIYLMLDGDVLDGHDYQTVTWQLINEGRISPLVIVGIPPVNRTYELTPTRCNCSPKSRCTDNYCNCTRDNQSGGNSLLLEFYSKTVLPTVLKKYGIKQLGKSAIGGWSFGGLTACHSAVTRKDLFSMGYCGSPALWWNCQEFGYVTLKDVVPGNTKLYIDYGNVGVDLPVLGACLNVSEKFKKAGFVIGKNLWLNLFVCDGHEHNSWMRRFWKGLLALYGY